MNSDYPFRDTSLPLCLTAEIERVAKAQQKSKAEIISDLAKAVKVDARQIYHFRQGKCEIPPEKIRAFCEVLNSAALCAAWVTTFKIEHPERGQFDLAKLVTTAVRENLSIGDAFMAAFEDMKITGFELSDLRMRRTIAVRNLDRLIEAAEDSYVRRCVA
jgi:hypothetical protein